MAILWADVSWFFAMPLSKWPPVSLLDFWLPDSNFSLALLVCMGRSLMIPINNTFKTTAWLLLFPDSNFSLALDMCSKPQ